ncbi:hypothetical protein WOLCODRAFT_165602 [Wolfiporia cocos MD-104 SS10]|uniref:Uncharacterized protein n=1 Tax=Wolfiporia cocos (strain MD-104) TaxID=742152 RepID=A0A2H3K1N8_WOLCO|nr:hypothetical protein WOLCODRAFT_165602 [Wolfiporia cocos MD-104 SS10]
MTATIRRSQTATQPTLSRFRVAYVTATRWCDISRARDALDYAPIASVEEGVQESVKWWMETQESRSGAVQKYTARGCPRGCTGPIRTLHSGLVSEGLPPSLRRCSILTGDTHTWISVC